MNKQMLLYVFLAFAVFTTHAADYLPELVPADEVVAVLENAAQQVLEAQKAQANAEARAKQLEKDLRVAAVGQDAVIGAAVADEEALAEARAQITALARQNQELKRQNVSQELALQTFIEKMVNLETDLEQAKRVAVEKSQRMQDMQKMLREKQNAIRQAMPTVRVPGASRPSAMQGVTFPQQLTELQALQTALQQAQQLNAEAEEAEIAKMRELQEVRTAFEMIQRKNQELIEDNKLLKKGVIKVNPDLTTNVDSSGEEE